MFLYINKLSNPPRVSTLQGDNFVNLDTLSLKFGDIAKLNVVDTNGSPLADLSFVLKTKDFDSPILIYAEGQDVAQLNVSSLELHNALGSLPELYCVGEFSYTDGNKRVSANINVTVENAVYKLGDLFPVPLPEYPAPEELALKADLEQYPAPDTIAVKSDLTPIQTDLDRYPEPEKIALKSDLAEYPAPGEIALKGDLPDLSIYPEPDEIAVKSDIPDLSVYPEPESIVVKTDLEQYPSPESIALKSELPDLSVYPSPEEIAVKSELTPIKADLDRYPEPGALALKAELPDLSAYPAPEELALKSDLEKIDIDGLPDLSAYPEFVNLQLSASDFPEGSYIVEGKKDFKLMTCTLGSSNVIPATKAVGDDLVIYLFDTTDDINRVYSGYFVNDSNPVDIVLIK